MDLIDLARRLRAELPAGISLCAIEPVPLSEAPLPSQVEAANYLVSFHAPPADLTERVQRLMAAESLPFRRVRKGKQVSFDLRPRVLRAEVTEVEGRPALALKLAHGPHGAARPEDVVAALGLDWSNARATRTGLVLAPEKVPEQRRPSSVRSNQGHSESR